MYNSLIKCFPINSIYTHKKRISLSYFHTIIVVLYCFPIVMEKHPPSVRDIPHASQDIISIRSYNTSASTVCVCVVGSGCTGNSYNVLFTIEPTAKQISVSRRQELSPFRFIQVNFLSLIHYYRLTRVNARNNGLLCCYCLVLVDVEAFFSQKREESTGILSPCIFVS